MSSFEKPNVPLELGPIADSSDSTISPPSGVRRKIAIQTQLKRQRRRRLIYTLVTCAAMAVVVGVLAGLLVRQVNRQRIAENDRANSQVVDPSEDDENPVSIDLRQNSTSAEALNKTEIQETPIRPEDIPPLRLEFLKRKQVDECWETVQPHLVSLKITGPRGKTAAVASIIDSRGWILTSYSSIIGASKIEVTASAKSALELSDGNFLTDLVRGVVAVDPENDLAILSINRRFIVVFSILKLTQENKIPRGDFLVQPGPPSRENLLGRTESEIIARGGFESLSPAGKSMAKKLSLTGADLTWLVASGQTTPLPGTPLFSIDGTMQAINVFSKGNEGYFLPVHHVNKLIDSSDGTVQPLPGLVGSTEDGKLVAVSGSHPMRDSIVLLNQLGDTCKAFDWIPKTESEYESLQKFAQQYSQADLYLESKAKSNDEDNAIKSQLDQWKNSLSSQFGSLSKDDLQLLKQMNNKFSSNAIKKPNQLVPFFGEVINVAIRTSQLRIELVESDSYANVLFDPSKYDEPIRIESRWMFFVRTPPARRRYNIEVAGRGKQPMESAELVFPVGPVR